jgi:tyrosine aminotransferase
MRPFLASVHSIFHSLTEVEAGAKRLAQVVLGASHLPQTAIPALLDQANDRVLAWKSNLWATLEEQATFVCHELNQVPCLRTAKPGGAMYALVSVNMDLLDHSISSDVAFSKALLDEENVFVLPGSCFGVENVFRVVYCAPLPVLKQATDRIRAFCTRHCVDAP